MGSWEGGTAVSRGDVADPARGPVVGEEVATVAADEWSGAVCLADVLAETEGGRVRLGSRIVQSAVLEIHG